MSEEQRQYDLYVITETNYRKQNKNVSEEDLFPADWYTISNNVAKIRILAEAMNNKVLVKETSRYQELTNNIRTK